VVAVAFVRTARPTGGCTSKTSCHPVDLQSGFEHSQDLGVLREKVCT
jgi:hypothetical protein